MSRRRSKLAQRGSWWAVLPLALALADPATPQGGVVPFAAEAAKAVTAKMEASPQVGKIFKACPADTFRRGVAESSGLTKIGVAATPERCAADPAGCYAACVGGSGSACFDLARAFQEHEKIVPPRFTQTAFSLSCSFGYGAGCTNRASSIRNSLSEGDPFREASQASRDSCQFRTFGIACRQGDAWGCAMLGQSYQYGEGVAASPSRAINAFRKSCRIADDFEACGFSKEGIRQVASSRTRR